MSIVAIIVAVVLGFLVLRFVAGMVKFVVLGAVLLALYVFMTGGFGV